MQGAADTLRRACALFGVIALAALVTGASAPRATSATPTGLVAAYAFDEASGATVADSSGNGNTGTISGATRSSAGRFGGALSFDGVDDLVTVADSPSLDLTSGMTLEAWVKPTSLGSSWRTAVIKEQSSALAYALYAHTGSYGPSGHVYTGGVDQRARATSTIGTGTWTHVAVTYDRATVRLYRNAAQIASLSQTGSIQTSSGALRIGGTQLWREWFSGLIDEVRVYDRALTASELQADSQAPVGAPAPDTAPPATPSGLARSGATATSVSLAWNASTDNVGVKEYGVYRNGARVATVTGTSATVTGLACGTTSTFGVDAADAAGNRSAISTISAATGACTDSTPPTAPTVLTRTGGTATSISLSWTASSDNGGVAGYGLWNGSASAGSTIGTTATVGGLACGTTYTLGVDAYDTAGNRSAKATLSTATAACPTTPPPSGDASLFVSTTGSDTSSCTASAPCRGFDRAYRVAQPGQIVEVAGGTYASQSIGKHSTKTSSADVVFRPAAGATVTLASLSVSGSHVEVRDMRLTGDGAIGSSPIDTRDVTFRNITARSFFLRADNVNVIGGSVGGFNACTSGMPEDGVKLWSDSTRGADGIVIDGLRIHDIRRVGCSIHSDCMQIYSGTNHTIKNSTFYNCPTTGIIARPSSSSQKLENITLENNFFGPVLDGVEAINIGTAPDRCANIRVRYNTVYNESSSFDCVTSTGAPGSRVEGNIISVATGNDATFAANVFRPGSAVVGSGVQCSPAYVGATSGNYHLAATDACARGRGATGHPATDLDGQPRPQGAVDAGADEIG